MSVFIKNGYFCIINKNQTEIQENYVHRGYAVVSQQPKNQLAFDKYLLLSNYLSNYIFLRCSYTPNINKECKMMNEKIFQN